VKARTGKNRKGLSVGWMHCNYYYRRVLIGFGRMQLSGTVIRGGYSEGIEA